MQLRLPFIHEGKESLCVRIVTISGEVFFVDRGR